MADNQISVEKLSKIYAGGKQAIADVSFTVSKGEIVGIIGPNGAGKSTTLNILATLVRPSSGSAHVFGHPLEALELVRPLLGVAMQGVGIDPIMTVEEHFQVHGALHLMGSVQTQRKTAELVEYFDLQDVRARRTGELSGGTQRRLSLALALMHEPSAIIFDEPTVGLDPNLRQDLWNILLDLRSKGLAILFSTHYLDEAEEICDRIVVMSEGAVVAQGRPDELKSNISREILRVRLSGAGVSAEEFVQTAFSQGILDRRTDSAEVAGGRVTIRTSEPHGYLRNITAQIALGWDDITDLQLGGASLNDVFLETARPAAEDNAPTAVTIEHRALARRRRGT